MTYIKKVMVKNTVIVNQSENSIEKLKEDENQQEDQLIYIEQYKKKR